MPRRTRQSVSQPLRLGEPSNSRRSRTYASQEQDSTISSSVEIPEPSTSQIDALDMSSPTSDNESDNDETFREAVDKLVNCILTHAVTNNFIKKSLIKTVILKDFSKNIIEKVEKKAKKELFVIYGMKLHSIDSQYFVTNELPPIDETKSDSSDTMKNITFLVLLHIFMSKGITNEKSIWDFLNHFHLLDDFDSHNSQQIQIKKTIIKTLLQQGYISLTEGEDREDEFSRIYKWGQRAELTVSKDQMLDFIVTLFPNTSKLNWEDQYAQARKQFNTEEFIDTLTNEVEVQDEDMFD